MIDYYVFQDKYSKSRAFDQIAILITFLQILRFTQFNKYLQSIFQATSGVANLILIYTALWWTFVVLYTQVVVQTWGHSDS